MRISARILIRFCNASAQKVAKYKYNGNKASESAKRAHGLRWRKNENCSDLFCIENTLLITIIQYITGIPKSFYQLLGH